MAEQLNLQLPSLAEVGSNAYHRYYNARRRANILLQQAEDQAVDISLLRQPETWEALPLFVKSLKALIRSARDTERMRKAFLAKKAWAARPPLKGQGPEAYAKLMGLDYP